jgi:hypothetical protein
MIAPYIQIILLITGILTLGVVIGLFAPQGVFKVVGSDANDAGAIFIARHWSLLVGLIGALLIYAAFHPEARVPIVIAAATEKIVGGVLVFTGPLRQRRTVVAAVSADLVMALLYIIYLAQGPT